MSIDLKETVKGYYRRAIAHKDSLDYDAGCKDLREAIVMDRKDPNNFRELKAKWEKNGKNKDKANVNALKGFLGRGTIEEKEIPKEKGSVSWNKDHTKMVLND